MNAEEKLALEIQELLDNTPVLTDETIQAVAEANRALNRDPEHIAGIIKAVFVNDIICAMEEQELNKNQLAKKWGKSRQYLGGLLDKEKARNFTIDTVVSLSMTLGLRPHCIKLEPMEMVAKVQVTATRDKIEPDAMLNVDWCKDIECVCVSSFDLKNTDQPDPVAADESYDLAA